VVEAQLAQDWSEKIPDVLDLDVVSFPGERPPVSKIAPFVIFDGVAANTEAAFLAAELNALADAEAEAGPKKSSAGKKTSAGAGHLAAARSGTTQKTTAGGRLSRQNTGASLDSLSASASNLSGMFASMLTDGGNGSGMVAGALSHQLTRFRWTVAAGESVTLAVRFAPSASGTFDQTLTLETVLGGLLFPARLRGISALPAVATDPAVLFASMVAAPPPKGFVSRTFVQSTHKFEFGPLLCGKSRDNYKADPASPNRVAVTLVNPTPLMARVSACFATDAAFATFSLEPAHLVLEPFERAVLSLWAYPKTVATYEDKLVLCISDNPAPLVVPVSVSGVEPALEMDRKHLAFDRTLLRRSDRKTLTLRNKTRLPAVWHLAGTEQLGSEFTFAALHGTVPPESEFPIDVAFSADKAMTISKRPLRLEVSDAEGLAGVVQTESVFISAEAYDAAVDIVFPRGSPDSGLDFETVRVGEEKALSCSLRNKGKYELKYAFVFNAAAVAKLGLPANALQVSPESGVLPPGDKVVSVRVAVHPSFALAVKSTPLLVCSLTDPYRNHENIADIPVTVTFSAVYSTYLLQPARGLHFGPTLLGAPKLTRELVLENTGAFEFRYHIVAMPRAPSGLAAGNLGGAAGAIAAAASAAAAAAASSKSGHVSASRPGARLYE
jgi:hydrocephalus-inducing protein